MTFWTYMLHCSDRTFYVGHTDDLEKRVGQHELGLVPGYTSSRKPVKLVWSEAFPTRAEAREAEERLKGWGRPKKLALIRGDWGLISALAQGRKEGASTSSAKPVSVFLHPHPNRLPSEPFSLEVTIRRSKQGLRLGYRLTGDVGLVRIPELAQPARQDGLWRHTCFEAFVAGSGDDGYREINLSPSGRWAAYRFLAYREGMAELPMEPPRIKTAADRFALEVKAEIPAWNGEDTAHLNLTAVLEEKSGHKSYWALAHPPGEPDFHHPACFVLELPPPSGA